MISHEHFDGISYLAQAFTISARMFEQVISQKDPDGNSSDVAQTIHMDTRMLEGIIVV